MASRPLPLEQLIGAPLRSLVLGQGIAAQATAEFVSELGFARGRGREPTARMIEFTYVHPVPDPSNPGEVIDTPTRVSIPLLTVFSVPNVRIDEATVTFGADIVDVRPSEKVAASATLEHAASAATAASLIPRGAEIIGAYATPDAGGGAPGALSFTIKVVREAPPQGIATIVSLLGEAVRSRPENTG